MRGGADLRYKQARKDEGGESHSKQARDDDRKGERASSNTTLV